MYLPIILSVTFCCTKVISFALTTLDSNVSYENDRLFKDVYKGGRCKD